MPRWIRPFVVLLVALGAGALLMAPMVSMEPRDLPVAVVDLDEGMETAAGRVSAGGQVAAAVQENDGDGMIEWVLLSSQTELDAALADGDVYAALVIPADFTASQAAAQQGAGEVSALRLVINEGKNPMVTSQLSGSLAALAPGSGVPVQTEYYDEVPESLGMLASFLPMVFMILTYISSYATGIVIRATFPLASTGRGRTVLVQLGLAAAAAAVVGVAASWVLSTMAPAAGLPVGDSAVFLAISSFALMTLVIGSVNWLGTAGMVVPVAMLVLGMGTADLPYEFLPAFWQDFVHPWNPLRFLADGGRALLFQGAGWWNAATPGMVITAVVGAVLVGTSVLTRRGRARETSHDSAGVAPSEHALSGSGR